MQESRSPGRVGSCLIGLAILAVAWFLLPFGSFGWPLTAAVAVTIILSTLLPPRIANIAGGVSLFGVAALLHFRHNAGILAVFVAVLGLIDLIAGIMRFTRREAVSSD